MIYVSGKKKDYEGWRERGEKGWGWDEVMKYLKEIERWKLNDNEGMRGR